jgi:hypothetical protein
MPMTEWEKKGLRSAFARASRAGRWAAKNELRAVRAAYRTRADAIELTNGAVITIPRKLIPDLKRAATSDVPVGRSAWAGQRTALGEPGPRSQCPWLGVVRVCRTRMDGRTGSRRKPAVIGGQSSRSAKEREERRSPADSGSGDYLERPCSQRAADRNWSALRACLLPVRKDPAAVFRITCDSSRAQAGLTTSCNLHTPGRVRRPRAHPDRSVSSSSDPGSMLDATL